MPSSETMSAPRPVFRSSESLVLYCSSSTPDGWNRTVPVTPCCFSLSVKTGITYLVIQSASTAFLPPEMAFAEIVSSTFLAPAPRLGSASPLAPTQPVAARATAARMAVKEPGHEQRRTGTSQAGLIGPNLSRECRAVNRAGQSSQSSTNAAVHPERPARADDQPGGQSASIAPVSDVATTPSTVVTVTCQ